MAAEPMLFIDVKRNGGRHYRITVNNYVNNYDVYRLRVSHVPSVSCNAKELSTFEFTTHAFGGFESL